jgi:hypothetical protein
MFLWKIIPVRGLLIAFAFFLFFFGIGGCKSLTPEDEIEEIIQNEPVNIPDDGYIRLVLNDKTGGFLLYYLADPKSMRYEPLFNANDPMASFLSVFVDGNVYRLGNSRQFTTRIERYNGDPAYIFEAPFLRVIQAFTPIKTSGSQVANGVMISIIVRNTNTQRSSVGVRMLIDTDLGEGRRRVPFLTNSQVVSSELLLEGNSDETFWVSRGSKATLMGSIVNPVEAAGKGPNLVHIANWKRLNDAPWRLAFSPGRSFNNLPHSIGDSAVCYYFGPDMLDRDKITTYTVFLSTEDLAWYNLTVTPPHMTASIVQKAPRTPAPQPARETTENRTVIPAVVTVSKPVIDIPALEAQARLEAEEKNEKVNIVTLIKLQELLNQFINGQIFLEEQDLTEIERAIERHRN